MKAEFDAADLVKDIVMHVRIKGMQRMTVRLWLAKLLLRSATVVAGLGGIEFDGEPVSAGPPPPPPGHSASVGIKEGWRPQWPAYKERDKETKERPRCCTRPPLR